MERRNEPPPAYTPDIYENKIVLRLQYFSGALYTSFGILYFIFTTLLHFGWVSLSLRQNCWTELKPEDCANLTANSIFSFTFSAVCLLAGTLNIVATWKRSRLGMIIIAFVTLIISCVPFVYRLGVAAMGTLIIDDKLIICPNEILLCIINIFVILFDYRDELNARLKHENLNEAAELNESLVVDRFSKSAVIIFLSNGVVLMIVYLVLLETHDQTEAMIIVENSSLILGILGLLCGLVLLIGIYQNYKLLILIAWSVQVFGLIIVLSLVVSGIVNLYFSIYSPTLILMFCIPYGFVLVDDYWKYRIDLMRQPMDQRPFLQQFQEDELLDESFPPDYEDIVSEPRQFVPPPHNTSSFSSQFATPRDEQIYLKRNENPLKQPNSNSSLKCEELNDLASHQNGACSTEEEDKRMNHKSSIREESPEDNFPPNYDEINSGSVSSNNRVVRKSIRRDPLTDNEKTDDNKIGDKTFHN